MDILDILIAKKKSFTGETQKLIRQANEAMAKANEVAGIITSAEEALDAAAVAYAATTSANEYAQETIAELDDIKSNITSAAESAVNNIIDEKITEATTDITSSLNSLSENVITSVGIETDNTSNTKGRKIRVRKNNIDTIYNVEKNYTSTGTNEDGSMTQKAITNALNTQKTQLEARIAAIPASGGSGNISGDISSEDAGSLISVGENGNITPSTITEEDVVITQIIAGTYKNDNIVGLELDYTNKSFRRLQGAIGKTAGSDFDTFNLYGGRKRCIVDEDGSIIKFIDNETASSELLNKRVMVYQPAFYYLRVPITLTGNKIEKEQIYVADQKYAGFKLHPAFYDENGNAVKFVLLPAFECAALHNNEAITDDGEFDPNNDKLISTINIKPISGYNKTFSYIIAETMCQNNGNGWDLMNVNLFSINQMLAIIEFGTPNIQSVLEKGCTNFINNNKNEASITGSTYDLYNMSGHASSTINNNTSYSDNGKRAVSYRGVENPYGGIWQIVKGIFTNNNTITVNNITVESFLTTTSDWIKNFGYNKSIDYLFLPAETGNGASSSLPIGDYCYCSSDSYFRYGGSYAANLNAGLFNYDYSGIDENDTMYNVSARVQFIPTANSSIETNNYTTWLNS